MDEAPAPPLNGLDLAAHGAMVEAMAERGGLARACFQVTTRWAGQVRSESMVEAITIGGERVSCSYRIEADEPCELFGEASAPNPQQLLMAAFNSCLMVGYVAGASVRGISLETIEIESRGELDLRGFLGISDAVPPGYQALTYDVRIKGAGTAEQFAEIHRAVMATSPNYFNLCRPVRMNGTLIVE
jgi:uncharacterized OsmC-like protein